MEEPNQISPDQANLHYEDWRKSVGQTSPLLGETDGYTIFNEISSWDQQNYNPTAVRAQWPHMVNSAEVYGPITWSRFNMDLSQVYTHVNPKSSLAGQVRRAVENASSSNTFSNPTVDNSQAVEQMLYTKTVTKGGQPVTTPLKSPSNLLIILLNDNRWAGLIRRNH